MSRWTLSAGVAIPRYPAFNISVFGLPKAAYLNPAWSGSASLSDAWTWRSTLLAQVKFLTLFALLFGAGSAIASAREALDPVAADAAGAARFHSRSFFWDGDILLAYALVGW